MKRAVWGGVGLVVVVVAGLALARTGATRAADPTSSSASVVRVTRRDIGSQVKATGVIKPRVGAEVKVGSRISGVVKRLYVQIGDSVAQGQLLAELDDRDLAARRRPGGRHAPAARGDAALRRGRSHTKARAVSARDSRASPTSTQWSRDSAVVAQQVAAARASLDYAAAQVAYARITAPIAGFVASVATEEGETVAASFSAPTFLTLLDPSRLEVWAYVDETDIGRIRTGQTARFTVDTYGDEEFEGRVTAVHPTAEIRDNVVDYVTVVQFQRAEEPHASPGDDHDRKDRARHARERARSTDSRGALARHARVRARTATNERERPDGGTRVGHARTEGRDLLRNRERLARGRRGPRRRRQHSTTGFVVIELEQIGKRTRRRTAARSTRSRTSR